MRKLILMMVLLLLMAGNAMAQVTRTSGQVLSQDDGLPIIGATVRIQGSDIATATDADGRFSLSGFKASSKYLEVSSIGYETKVVEIKPEVTVHLAVKSEMMDEVMVVAFGKQKRESFTGSASVLSADAISKQQVTNPIEALDGLVTGLQMTQTNSFGSDPSILIRGIGSINASTAPLIVLDGLPYNGYWNDINPADIQNITVLKDAASNALYGARGANGVILITTKSAQRGETRVNITAKWGVNTDGRIQYDYIDNPGEYYAAHYTALRNYLVNVKKQNPGQAHINANRYIGESASEGHGGLGYMVYNVPAGEFLIGTNGQLNPNAVLGNRVAYQGQIYTLYPDNWLENGTRNGFRQEYNINITGGNDRYTILGNFGYLKEDGLTYGNDFDRISARIKTDYQAYDFLRIGGNASYNHTVTNVHNAAFGTTYTAPIYPLFIRDADGNIMSDAHGLSYDYGNGVNGGLTRPVETNYNPIQDDLLSVNNNSSNAFSIQGYATADFLKYFKFTVNGSVYVTENRMNTAYDPWYGYNALTKGYVWVGHYRTTDTNYQQLLNFNHVIGLHSIDVLLGHEYSMQSQTSLSADKKNVALYGTNYELSGAIINGDMGSDISKYNVEGFFMRAQYDYDNRYFGSVSFRRDGSSRFAPGHRWGNFWSVGGAWIMTKEEWFPKSNMVNMLKYKISYGEQGNDGIGNYRYTDLYNITNSNNEVAFVFSSKGNRNITWETVGSFNTGIEFELFNSRLRGTVDYYDRKTRDMLIWFSAPTSIGYSGYYDNVGDMVNRGVEIDLSGDIIATRDFTWTVGLNMSWQHNEVTYLPEDKKGYSCDGYNGYSDSYYFVGEGLPMYTWRVKRYAGVNDQGEPLYYRTNANGELETTNVYSNGDYYLCGSALPDLFGGFNTSIKAFGFDLSAQFNYSIGGRKWDSGYQSLMTPPYGQIVGRSYHRDIYNAWTPENPDSNIPRWQYDDMTFANASDRWLIDGSYLSLRNITLGYTFPRSITSKLKMQSLRIYASCENLYYWTKRKGFDPRMSLVAGSYSDDYSPMRNISGGISVQF